MTASSALALGQRSNPEMGEVKEERFARVHWASWGPKEDCICWVLVKPATGSGAPLDTFGHSKVFELILVDGRSGKTVWAGGAMAGGGGQPG
ncbi:MAG: hypothetical protein M3Z11_09155 [Candidatus Dormibacteraeota bacterium]|nr:hypothetical protein [Candidatus Dormibacteraeota bacterium]